MGLGSEIAKELMCGSSIWTVAHSIAHSTAHFPTNINPALHHPCTNPPTDPCPNAPSPPNTNPCPIPSPPQLHWPMPERLGCVSVRRILHSRAGASLVREPYYTATPLQRVRAALGAPLKGAAWALIRALMEGKFRTRQLVRLLV